jgi:hypothetical protein
MTSRVCAELGFYDMSRGEFTAVPVTQHCISWPRAFFASPHSNLVRGQSGSGIFRACAERTGGAAGDVQSEACLSGMPDGGDRRAGRSWRRWG